MRRNGAWSIYYHTFRYSSVTHPTQLHNQLPPPPTSELEIVANNKKTSKKWPLVTYLPRLSSKLCEKVASVNLGHSFLK